MQPPDVDKAEQKRIEARGFRNFLETDENGVNWIKCKNDGSCLFLAENNRCKIYDVRPSVCKLEPFTIVDYNYETGTVELDLNFPFTTCCGGVNEKGALNKVEIAEAACVLVKKILALTAIDMDLPVSNKQVEAETRSRILRRTVEAADLHL